MFNPFTRDELQQIKSRARYLSEVKGTSPEWVRLYQKLEDVCCCLDAFIARTEVKSMPDQHAPSRSKERK